MKKTLCFALLALSLAGCGVIKATEAIPDKMDALTKNMSHTNGRVDDQAKAVALDGLLKSENREKLSPVPTLMLPYGKMLGELLTAEELIEFIELGMAEINEVFPDHKTDASGNEVPYTADETAAINHDKLSRLVGLQIVAGFAPQSVIDQVVSDQIFNGGPYEQDAYTLLMLRVEFIRDIRLDAQLLSAPLENAGLVASAVEWNTKIDAIAKLAFVDRIHLKTTGFLPSENSPVEKLDPKIALNYWNKIQLSASRDFRVSSEAMTGNQGQDQAYQQQQMASYNQSTATIASFIASWQSTQK